MQEFFSENNYRDAIKKSLDHLKSRFGIKRYSFQKMALHCGVEKSYISKVFSGGGHLSADQLFLVAEFLGLNQEEQNFLWLLFDQERSGLHARKLVLQRQIDEKRQGSLRSELTIKSPPLSENVASSKYYSDINHLLVHMALMIPAYTKNLAGLSEALKLDREQLDDILQTLASLGLADISISPPRVLKSALHLPSGSWLNSSLQQNLRVLVLENLRRAEKADHHYGAVFAADFEARSKIKGLFIEFMGQVEQIVLKAPAEHVFGINFDLFSTQL